MVNTFAIRQQFEWAWMNKVPPVDLWHGYKAEEFGYDEEARLETKALFDAAEMFIITLGLSEIWYDEPTGEVFWRAVPMDRYDPARHKFRVSTHSETLDNLRAIHALIRKHRPDAAILFTVSPIPLTATFRSVACISANAVSKSILRSAVDEVYRDLSPTDPKLFYFPSYDVVMYGFNHQWTSDRKHVYSHVLDFNMKLFERYFCDPGIPDADLLKSYKKARTLDKRIGKRGHESAAVLADKSVEERLAIRKAAKVAAKIEAKREARIAARKQAKVA